MIGKEGVGVVSVSVLCAWPLKGRRGAGGEEAKSLKKRIVPSCVLSTGKAQLFCSRDPRRK